MSGTAAVLELARLLHGCNDAAFILFDDEEKGKKGSKAWAKAHPDAKANALIINMDCVGNGDRFIVCVPDPARGDAAYPVLETALKSIEAGIYPARKTAMNSDQKSFDKGIGICACLYKKGIGCYTPRIHTSRDTVASNKNISALCGALAKFVKSIAG